MSTVEPVLTVTQAAAKLGTDPARLAERLHSPPPSRQHLSSSHVPSRRRSSFNEDWWIDDDGAWTDGRDRVLPAAETAAAWRAATASYCATPRVRRNA